MRMTKVERVVRAVCTGIPTVLALACVAGAVTTGNLAYLVFAGLFLVTAAAMYRGYTFD